MDEITEQSFPELIEVYADGSGNTFNSDGGFGWCVVIDGVLYKKGSGYLTSATNNVAEITGAITGLKEVQNLASSKSWGILPKVVLVSDSQLTLGYASGRFKCKAEHLKPLAAELKQLYIDLAATDRWVKGHAGDRYNELCDKLAGKARKSKGSTSSEDLHKV